VEVDVDGHPVHFEHYRGQWVVIHYWADWCHSCIAEIADLNDIQAHYPAKVFGFNADGLENDSLRALIQKHRIEYAQLVFDPKGTLGLEPLRGIPTLYLISPEGAITGPLEGPQSKEKIISLLKMPTK
jgi:thiol-disulfide isomerase/thioredoxin